MFSKCFKFAFVRHPVDRLLSLYSYAHKLAEGTPMAPEEQAAFDRDGTLPDRAPYRYKAVRAALKSKTFSDFAVHPAHLAGRRLPAAVGERLRQQRQDDRRLRRKVETIEQDWAHLTTQLAIEAPLEVRNASGGRGTSQAHAGRARYGSPALCKGFRAVRILLRAVPRGCVAISPDITVTE
jgi:hypothetical protein